jgi:glutamate-1-semialdehyde 2,1-aminomutase
MTSHNQELFDQSQKLIPGGVNSPVRAFKSVGGTPLFFKRGKGAYVWDADDKRYIDYVNSWGPMIVGHCHPDVVKAVQAAAAEGLGFGAPTAAELEIAETLCKILPPGKGATGQPHGSHHDRDPSGARIHGAFAHHQI